MAFFEVLRESWHSNFRLAITFPDLNHIENTSMTRRARLRERAPVCHRRRLQDGYQDHVERAAARLHMQACGLDIKAMPRRR